MGQADAATVGVTRSGWLESEHRVHVAVCSAAGELVAWAGDPWRFAFWRSSAKPVQALPLVESGAADALGLESAHLAIACASHRGAAEHTAAAAGLLARAGLDPAQLRCGIHAPEDGRAAADLVRRGQEPVRLHNNCSGKHAGMLAVAVHRGWPLETYLDPEHPLQREIADVVAACAGARPVLGTDGCGVPTFGLPLAGMATAFARLGSGTGLEPGRARAAERLAAAMAAHPRLISGEGHVNTELLARHGSRLIAKGGAEGVWCVGLREAGPGLGIAVKVEDGSGRAPGAAMLTVLAALGLPGGDDPALETHRRPPVLNTLGQRVGEISVRLPQGFGPRQGASGRP